MNRKEFLTLSKSLILGLGTHQAFGRFADAQTPQDRQPLDDSYLVKGLTAMARAKGWFNAHWGAAVLAGYYLCNENVLDRETTHAIRKQLDAMIKLRKTQFERLPQEKPDQALIEEVPKALAPAIAGGLRAHGHAVIFASLSTKALRHVPHMAQPKLIDGLCGLSRQIAKKSPARPEIAKSYDDTQAMIEATFDSLARFEPILGRPSVKRPNFTHMTTHSEALMNFESMGYAELARAGYLGHQAHVGVPVPHFDPELHPTTNHRVTLEDVTRASFWESEQNLARWNNKWSETVNRNGYWVAIRSSLQGPLQLPSPDRSHQRYGEGGSLQHDPAGAIPESGGSRWLNLQITCAPDPITAGTPTLPWHREQVESEFQFRKHKWKRTCRGVAMLLLQS